MNKIKLALITFTLVAGCTTLISQNKVAATFSVIGLCSVLSTEIKTFKQVFSMLSFK